MKENYFVAYSSEAQGASVSTYDKDLRTGISKTSEGIFDLLGFDSHEIPSDPNWFETRIHPDDKESVLRAYSDPSSTDMSLEYRVKKKDGSYIQIWDQSFIIRDERGTPIRVFGVNFDVSDRKKIELTFRRALAMEQLARIELEEHARAKDQLLAIVSHELRSPLQSIGGWIQLLRRGNLDPATFERALSLMETSVEVQKRLVDDLIESSRMVTGKIELLKQPTDLSQIVASACDSVRPLISAKGLHLVTQIDPKLEGELDGARIHQVLWNLLSNAIKFTPAGKSIYVRAWENNAQHYIEIKDEGQGFDPGFASSIFPRFTQERRGHMARREGLGLGLSIVKHIVELHGGNICASSLGHDQGSSFEVSIPNAIS